MTMATMVMVMMVLLFLQKSLGNILRDFVCGEEGEVRGIHI